MKWPFYCCIAIAFSGCNKAPPTQPIPDGFTARTLTQPDGLHNLIQVNDWLYTGSEPEGDLGFASLADLGIRTVITVDGTKPDLAIAEKNGLRYVHLPIGYNAIPQDRVLQIAKAMQTLPRPIYLHCHHGKHRGPAAAIAALRSLDGSWTSVGATRYLQFAGTDFRYAELYASAEAQSVVESAVLEKVPAEFPATSEVPNLTERMLEIDKIFERLKQSHIRKEKFSEQDAILLREHYREMIRESGERPEEFRKILGVAEASANQIVNPTYDWAPTNGYLIGQSCCYDCHKAFRDRIPPK